MEVACIGAEVGEPHVDIFTPVIDCVLIAELFDAEALLGRAAGDPDGAATADIRDLSGSRAHRACGGRDDDGFALLRLSDYREGGMSRRAVDPEATAGGGQWQIEIGRAHVCTPVTIAHLVIRLLLRKKKSKHYHT